jgi:hypothetical protein
MAGCGEGGEFDGSSCRGGSGSFSLLLMVRTKIRLGRRRMDSEDLFFEANNQKRKPQLAVVIASFVEAKATGC